MGQGRLMSVIHSTEHYKVCQVDPPDEKTYPKWEILDWWDDVVFTCALNMNFKCPQLQAIDICDALEEAFREGTHFDS